MTRPLRIEYPGAWYHVMNWGRRGERIFIEKMDKKVILNLPGEMTDLHEAQIHAYALMTNHYHLLISTPKGNLSRCMKYIGGLYAQEYYSKYGFQGSMFQGRYRSILIEKRKYLLELLRYIHKNPMKAGLEQELGQYKWTSHNGYLRKRKRPKWLTAEEVLVFFGSREKEARHRYLEFMGEDVPEGLAKKLDGMKWPAILGGETFENMIKEKYAGKVIGRKEQPAYKSELIRAEEMREEINLILVNYRDII